MTRKDYVLLAEAIKDALQDDPAVKDGIALAAAYIGYKLVINNPKFDRKRFMRACGISE